MSPDARLHVLFIDHCARLGGAQFGLLGLAEDLLLAGHRCSAILAEQGPVAERLRRMGVSVTVLSGLGIEPADPATPDGVRPPRRLGDWWRLVHVVRRTRPDVVHINSHKALLTAGSVLRLTGRRPVVWAVRDIIVAPHVSRVVAVAVRLAARFVASVVVANSRSSAAATGVGGLVTTHLVHPGVGPLKPRDDVAVGEGPMRVIVLGRLAPWKGQDVVVDAVKEMSATGLVVDFVGTAMFGEDDYEHRLDEQIRRLGLSGRVRLAGGVDEPTDVLAGYDVLVHASRAAEAFGRVVAEGMTAGLAVVATRTGGPEEQITDGVDGLLVPPDDPRALADALDLLVGDTDLRERLGRTAKTTAARFGRDRQLAGWLAAYRHAVTGVAPLVPDARISLVIPSYNRPESLDRTLRSLTGLVEPPFETVVVARPDDTATRDTATRSGARVATVSTPGLAAAMAAGAATARGDVVAFTDDDAEPRPDWTRRIREAYALRPGLGAFGGRDDVVGKDEPRIASDRVGQITWFGRAIGYHHRGEGPPVSTRQLKGVNLTMRRELILTDLGDRVHGAGAQHGNELFLCLTARSGGWDVVYDPALEVLHHAEPRDDGSARREARADQLADEAANRVAAAVSCGRGSVRWSVPLYTALVGERARPGVARGLMAASRGDRSALRRTAAVLTGVGRGAVSAVGRSTRRTGGTR